MNIEHVLEFSRPSIDGNIIKAVKIIGLKSKHGWSYSPPVLKEAIPLYESSPVFIEHPDSREKAKGYRQLGDHFGSLENILGNGQGLFGDLKIKPSHPLAEKILESAAAARFGLSHNAVVEMDEGKVNVTRIVEVNSVDLVNSPATTKNLFEGQDQAGEEVIQGLLETLARIEEMIESQVVVTEAAATPPPIRLIQPEGNGGGGAVGKDHDAFLARLKG